MRTFLSDNAAGLCPEALAAVIEANDGAHVAGYGNDPFTERATAAFREIFGSEIGVWFVATGTAANVLAIAAMTEPWQRVICHRHSHYNDDESTAPERLTHCRTMAIETDPTRLTAEDVSRAGEGARGDVHEPQPGAVTISNPSEFGTVYRPAEVAAICDAAHAAGYHVHVDGARFANAVASLGCDPRDLTVRAGVDAMSFGGTKNGLACGEAVLFFPQGDGRCYERAHATFEFHRKGTGHLLSKHRFVTAPFAATLEDGAWLAHAGHANRMAARLAGGLHDLGIEPAYPVEANGVFAPIPGAVGHALRAAGHRYYPFGDPRLGLSRLMCSFDTREAEVDGLLAAARPATLR